MASVEPAGYPPPEIAKSASHESRTCGQAVREAAAAEMEAMMEPEPEPEPAEGSRAAALIYSGERGRRSSSCGVFGCGWVSMR